MKYGKNQRREMTLTPEELKGYEQIIIANPEGYRKETTYLIKPQDIQDFIEGESQTISAYKVIGVNRGYGEKRIKEITNPELVGQIIKKLAETNSEVTKGLLRLLQKNESRAAETRRPRKQELAYLSYCCSSEVPKKYLTGPIDTLKEEWDFRETPDSEEEQNFN